MKKRVSIRAAALSIAVVLCILHQDQAFQNHPINTADLSRRHDYNFPSAVRRLSLLHRSSGNNKKNRGLFVAADKKGNQQSTSEKADDKKSSNTKNEKDVGQDDQDDVDLAPPRYNPPKPHMEDAFVGAVRGSKFRKLKDMMWIRETIEDLTAAEFACSVEAHNRDDDNESEGRKRRRAVDYEKLLAQLNKRLRDLGCQIEDNNASAVTGFELKPDVGRGTTVYDDDQRNQLLERVLTTRMNLVTVLKSSKKKKDSEKEEDSIDLPFPLKMPSIPHFEKEDNTTSSSGPKLYVRDDGTVDWDGALQDRAALQQFGTAVWARINGQDPTSISSEDDAESNKVGGHGGAKAPVTAKIEDTPQIRDARKKLNDLENELSDKENDHTRLLNSALSEGQAVANVNLASLAPSLRVQIRESADEMGKKKQEVAYQTLIYELERIYTYLVGEVGNPANKGYVPLQDRLNVAEFGLLEAQIDSFTRQLEAQESVDADVLVVVGDQVTELKRRLGIDFYVTGLTFDAEAIKRVLGDLLDKTKKGLAFYGRGIQLFWNDIVFCSFLIGRAAQGYTLKPREVRNLRRTIKDFFTFIPFIIILLIPLSPVGHVLVFGAIQRFFPDFFPSCFTEQRQNLLQLYETAEYSEFKIKESLGQKLARITVAAGYLIANVSRTAFARVMELARGDQGSAALDSGDGAGGGIDDSAAPNGSSKKN